MTNGKQGEATDISLLGIQKSQENSSKVVEINRLLISEDFPVFNPLIDNDGGVYYTRKPVEGDSLELIYRSNSLYIAKRVTTCFGTMFGVGEKGICFDIMETGVRSVVFMNHLGDSFTVLDNAYICGRSCDGNIVLIKNYLGELFQYDCSTELLIKLLDNQSLLESLMMIGYLVVLSILLSSRRVACGRDERGGERQRGNGKNRKSNCANGSCSRVLVIF